MEPCRALVLSAMVVVIELSGAKFPHRGMSDEVNSARFVRAVTG